MDDRVKKFRVGVVVLACSILGGILVLLFSDASSVVRGSYTLYIHFNEAPGVSDGTPIRKSGILIGRVTNVRFADQGGVIVTAKIDGTVKLYHDEVPQVSGSLLGGDVVIQFLRMAKPHPQPVAPPASSEKKVDQNAAATNQLTADPVVEGPPAATAPPATPQPAKPLPENPNDVIHDQDYIEGTVAANAFQVIGNLESELGTAVSSLSNAGNEVAKLAGYFNKLLENNDEQVNRIVNKTEATLDSLQKALINVDDVLGNEQVRENLKRSISELPELLTDTRNTMSTMRSTIESVDRNVRNLEGFTGPLGEKGGEMVNHVDQAVTRLDGLLAELTNFSEKLNSGEGSLGQLMRNPDLYQHLNAAAKNIECISKELKPILADARVFSDKIARHPELLGVRGAIQKSPGTK